MGFCLRSRLFRWRENEIHNAVTVVDLRSIKQAMTLRVASDLVKLEINFETYHQLKSLLLRRKRNPPVLESVFLFEVQPLKRFSHIRTFDLAALSIRFSTPRGEVLKAIDLQICIQLEQLIKKQLCCRWRSENFLDSTNDARFVFK